MMPLGSSIRWVKTVEEEWLEINLGKFHIKGVPSSTGFEMLMHYIRNLQIPIFIHMIVHLVFFSRDLVKETAKS